MVVPDKKNAVGIMSTAVFLTLHMPAQKASHRLNQFVFHLACRGVRPASGQQNTAQHIPFGQNGRGGEHKLPVTLRTQHNRLILLVLIDLTPLHEPLQFL